MTFSIDSPGYPVLGLLVLVGAVGAPLPLTVALAGAGALARQGQLNAILLFMLCAAAAVAGDCLGYAAGRLGIRRLPVPAWAAPWLLRIERSIPACTRQHARMGMLVFMTRWAITAPAPVVNVLAGARSYSLRSYVFLVTAGEVIWCVTALGPGYLLGESKEIGVPLSIAVGLVLAAGGLLLSRHFKLASHVAGTTSPTLRRRALEMKLLPISVAVPATIHAKRRRMR